MKKSIFTLALLAAFMLTGSTVHALQYSFTPYDGAQTSNDINELDHYKIYLWSISSTIPATETIVSASITFSNIYNWDKNSNILKLYLLDNPKRNDVAGNIDIIQITDNQLTTNEIAQYKGTKFTDYIDLWSWIDTDGPDTKNTLTYNFDQNEISTLTSYLGTSNPFTYSTNGQTLSYNATFGLGFDPDCHYFNDGITLNIETANTPVPEPSTFILFGAGLLGAGLLRRRSKNK